MDPILNGHFNKFKQSFEIDTSGMADEQIKKNSVAFEKFVNYVIFSEDDPDVFTGNIDLLNFVCVGGGHDTGIDGIGIKVNDHLIRNIDEVKTIVQANKKINVEFVFVQSKMGTNVEMAEFLKFGLGVKNFFSIGFLPENPQITELREIKDFIYSDQLTISKLDTNPLLWLYYATTGQEPKDENYKGTHAILQKELSEASAYFDNINISAIGGKELVKACRELENKFEVQINIIDIFPLIVKLDKDVKKAYAFTCSASEYLKLIEKDDGSLRRSLFNDNVRDYLGRTAVNIEMEKTVVENPEMFLLCNNGITIVCNDFDQVRDKLVKIENPQVVNGCQTSTSLFNLRSVSNFKKIQLLIKVISTDNLTITNKIVRGTNKQNMVYDEAFETTLPFHQEVLEPFFLNYDNPVKIYYERRSKQYNNEPLIKKTQIVNLRILTQAFVSIFLDSPHKGHIHEAKLLQEFASDEQTRKIFRDDHGPYPYYVCALTSYMFEKYFRENKIPQSFMTYKAHLYLIFKYSIGEYSPSLVKSKKSEDYCKNLIEFLTEPRFGQQIKKVVPLFVTTQQEWLNQGNSKFGIKDREDFTHLLIRNATSMFIKNGRPTKETEKVALLEGDILNISRRPDGTWFGFIGRGSFEQNTYFDNRAFKDDPSKLSPHTHVKYKMERRPQGEYATFVEIINKKL